LKFILKGFLNWIDEKFKISLPNFVKVAIKKLDLTRKEDFSLLNDCDTQEFLEHLKVKVLNNEISLDYV
jgi:hypothetical protein